MGEVTACYYWNFDKSLWSSDGCHKVEEESDLLTTVCKCNHLSNSAALMDMSGSEKRDNLKSQLTYFCSGFSVCGLLATIVIILKRRIKNKDEDESGKSEHNTNSVIICFLCVSLIIVNILVVTTMDKTDSKVRNTKGSNFYLKDRIF